MKIRFCERLLVLVGLLTCVALCVPAQQNASSASVSRSRAIVSAPAGTVTQYPQSSTYYQPAVSFRAPDEVAVEEFLNYHKHRLPLPKAGQAVAMDTRFGNGEYSAYQRDAVLQIGFTTAEVNERSDLRPLNLSLVIDKSGSMAAGDKMSRVKESLLTMIGKLRSQDIVSIVVFDTRASVLFPAAAIGDGHAIRQAIDCLQPGGSTNLHGGLMLGYAEARKNFRPGATNRVILLTDGIANVGVTDPAAIAAESSECNGQGVDLSTIGVGLDLNNDLLRTLAKSGRGLYHFVSDYQDIEKVFVTEVQSLVSSVAKSARLNVEYDPSLRLEKVYGYTPRLSQTGVSIDLDDMNNGLTQVVMMRFSTNGTMGRNLPVRVRISYFDVAKNRTIEELQVVDLRPGGHRVSDFLTDTEVKKNYTIAELAQSLFDMKAAVSRGQYRAGQGFLDNAVATTRRRYPHMEDTDISFVANIVEGYRRDLTAYNRPPQGMPNSDCAQCR